MTVIHPFFTVPPIQNLLYNLPYQKAQKPTYFVYKMTKGEQHSQGLIAIVSLKAVHSARLIAHEQVFPGKVQKFLESFQDHGIQTNPVFLMHQHKKSIEELLNFLMAAQAPRYVVPIKGESEKWLGFGLDALSEGGFGTEASSDNASNLQLWLIDDVEEIQGITELYNQIQDYYIADGHHRIASLTRYYSDKDKPSQRVLAYLVSNQNSFLSGFNKLLHDLDNWSDETILLRLSTYFVMTRVSHSQELMPEKLGMYLSGQWHALQLKTNYLDHEAAYFPALLLDYFVFDLVLGIKNKNFEEKIISLNHRIPLATLEHQVNTGFGQAAFYVPSLSMQDFFSCVQNKQILPPHTTCFEPKINEGSLSLRILNQSAQQAINNPLKEEYNV